MSYTQTLKFTPHTTYDEKHHLNNAAANELLRVSGKPPVSIDTQLESIATKWNLDDTQRASLRAHLAGGNPPGFVVHLDNDAAAALAYVISRFSPETLGVAYKAWNRVVEALSPLLPDATEPTAVLTESLTH